MRTLILSALLATLAACNTQPTTEVVDTNPDPMANTLANAAPVELPPAMRAEKTMRCADGSVVAVVFFKGDKQINVRTPPTASPQRLTSETEGGPYTADGGWEVTGGDEKVSLTQPGKKALACHT